MIAWLSRPTQQFEVACTLEIEQTHEHFHAHLLLDGDLKLNPGDQVRLHGAPIHLNFGQSLRERRLATISRANWLTRFCTRIAARLELNELYDVSFSGGRLS